MMKRLVYVFPLVALLTACLLLGGCSDNSRAIALLSRADSLMADRPDSALQILTQKGRFLLCTPLSNNHISKPSLAGWLCCNMKKRLYSATFPMPFISNATCTPKARKARIIERG